ncbi:MAG TPA: GrpB family protein [Candidatus Paceibacterota bacterium]
MTSKETVNFLPADELFEKAAGIFVAQKKELEKILPSVDIQQVGSSSVRGLIGKLDVDVQIRVTKEKFQDTVTVMQKKYVRKHPEIWEDNFALFCNNKDNLIDLIVTVIGSKHDDFYHEVRDTLAASENLKKEYNDLKRRYEGRPYSEYRSAKAAFLAKIGGIKFNSMQTQPKKTPLIVLGVTAVLCSRLFFAFIDDPEGPNLLIVMVLALVLYFLSLSAFSFKSLATNTRKFLFALSIQVLAVVILHLFLN